MKNLFKQLIMISIGVFILGINSYAANLLTKEQALKEMFPDMDKVVTENHILTDVEINLVKSKLGGAMVHYQDGSKSEEVIENNTYDFYIGIKNNQKVRMAIIEKQPGKWGPVVYIVAVDIPSGKVNNLAVMEYKEKRGQPIARRNFLDQFISKKSSDPISVRGAKGSPRDIRAISGATISSDATCFAVRKVLALYDNVYMKSMFAVK